jgi:hypothetical protein
MMIVIVTKQIIIQNVIWQSPDNLSGIDNLFELIGLYGKSKSLIISMNLCSIKNMIQLYKLDLHEVGTLFSRQDLRDSVF